MTGYFCLVRTVRILQSTNDTPYTNIHSAAYAINIGMLVNGIVIQQYGIKNGSLAGVPITDPAQTIPIWKCLWVVTQLKNPSFAFTRFSLLALFLRLFHGRLVRLSCYALIAFVVAQTIAYNIAGVFQCLPVEYFWTEGES